MRPTKTLPAAITTQTLDSVTVALRDETLPTKSVNAEARRQQADALLFAMAKGNIRALKAILLQQGATVAEARGLERKSLALIQMASDRTPLRVGDEAQMAAVSGLLLSKARGLNKPAALARYIGRPHGGTKANCIQSF